MREQLPKLIAIVGPTASGKTDLALVLAKKFDGEIISADSRQFYRGTEIGSDIPQGKWRATKSRAAGTVPRRGLSPIEKAYIVKGIPHHLMAFLSPRKSFTAAQFKEQVILIARDIEARGHLPILVGGTGLFIRVVVENFEIPAIAPNPAFRERMEKKTTRVLFAMLTRRDSAYACRIPKNNRRYIIRALEVIDATGRPFSVEQGKGEPLFDVLEIGIRRDREVLYARINARVDAMMKRGLLAEARRLGKRYGWSIPAMMGLGHRQLGLFIQGKISFEEAVELIKRDTRHYAKRQLTWFRRDKRIKWVKNEAEATRFVKAFLKRQISA